MSAAGMIASHELEGGEEFDDVEYLVEMDNGTAGGQCDCLGSIMNSQFRENIFDVPLSGGFADT